jgi:D-glycero-alpha-D-manno-heptose-7-phosphate kinase
MIITRTPFRISLFGGGTDYPEWFLKNNGRVVSMAIDKFCYISAREFPDFFDHNYRISYSKIEKVKKLGDIAHPAVREAIRLFMPNSGLEIQHQADLPGRSGIGSSSAFAIGLINALTSFQGQVPTPIQLADMAINFERNNLGETVGYQDQIACAIGGMNDIQFNTEGNWKATRIDLIEEDKEILENSLILVYSGIQRNSSKVSESLLEQMKSKEQIFMKIHHLASDAARIFTERSDFSIIGEMLKESWNLKKASNPSSVSSKLQNFWESGIEHGAIGGKMLGAGGGGFFMFWVPEKNRKKFLDSIAKSKIVPFKIENKGTERIFHC